MILAVVVSSVKSLTRYRDAASLKSESDPLLYRQGGAGLVVRGHDNELSPTAGKHHEVVAKSGTRMQ